MDNALTCKLKTKMMEFYLHMKDTRLFDVQIDSFMVSNGTSRGSSLKMEFLTKVYATSSHI